jgi:ABC-2 type transport system permease protein
MGPVGVITVKDLRQRWRDHSALLAGVVAPLIMAFLISLAFGRGETRFTATYALVDQDHGPIAAAFHDLLAGDDLKGIVTLRVMDDPAAAIKQARDGKVAAAFVLPSGMSAVTDGRSTSVIAITRSPRNPIGGDVAESIARGFAAHVEATRLSVSTALAYGAPPTDIASLAAGAAVAELPLAVQEMSSSKSDVSAASYFAPAMGVFFTYFVAALGARSLIAERKQGTLVRLLAAPVSGRALLAGKALSTLLLGSLSLSIMAIASRLLFGAQWGNPWAAGAIIVAIAFAVTAMTACVLTLARTEQQVGLLMSVVTYAMALLGGNFVSLQQAPALLRKLSLLTPKGWALRAFEDLTADGGGITSVWRPLAAISAFGVVTAVVAVVRAPVLVQP